MRSKSLPNFLVIGAPRCATTSLFHYLRQHPDVYLPRKKELHYFSYEYLKENCSGPGDKAALATLPGTMREYEMHYSGVGVERAIGEISPSYLYWSGTSERILATLGRVRIVAVLRDPIDRAFSQYMHVVSLGRETLDFYDALMAEEERRRQRWGDIWRYAEHSLYADKVSRCLAAFGSENVKIILFEELVGDTPGIMEELFRFLQVDPQFGCDTSTVYNRSGVQRFISEFLKKHRAIEALGKRIVSNRRLRDYVYALTQRMHTGKRPAIDARSARHLLKYCSGDVERLEAILGRPLPWLKEQSKSPVTSHG